MRNDEEDEDAISIEDVGHNITKEEVSGRVGSVPQMMGETSVDD